MDKYQLKDILLDVKNDNISIEDAILKLKSEPYSDLGFAKPDYHRSIRQGIAEVIYGQGKTTGQIIQIIQDMICHNQKTIIVTRISAQTSKDIGAHFPFEYNDLGKIGIVGEIPKPETNSNIVIATAGTSDIPVAEEAAVTAQALGNKIVRLYDVGVAGLHRLLSHKDEIMTAKVIIAIAGMEGALASVIGGLADCPVIAVPTSVGYGASFGGVSALLSMLNSCASGVSVVNIDNGFGAGYLASMINHI